MASTYPISGNKAAALVHYKDRKSPLVSLYVTFPTSRNQPIIKSVTQVQVIFIDPMPVGRAGTMGGFNPTTRKLHISATIPPIYTCNIFSLTIYINLQLYPVFQPCLLITYLLTGEVLARNVNDKFVICYKCCIMINQP